MKKRIILVTAVIAVFALICSILLGSFVLFAKKRINYEFDEELFMKAKDDKTVYYYAYNSVGELSEVYKGVKNEKREWTSFQDVSLNLKLGFLAMEDREFYKHKGVNLKRTAAAMLNYVFKQRPSFGASTITQQVIKNISGDNETSVLRKLKEIFRSLNLERNHSKDDIFELYLNIIPMSGNVYGVGAASEIYFGKEASELTLSEAATIVGITNAPSKYNPYIHPDACIEKRNKVLYAMHSVGSISDREYVDALKAPLVLNKGTGNYGVSSWFIETAREEIIADVCSAYDVSEAVAGLLIGGSKVILTMNSDIQSILDEYFSNTDNLSENFLHGLNYSMVVSDPYTGDLLGIVGNAGKKKAERLFNYATSRIVPGSVLKPIALYAPLIEENVIDWSTVFDDSPVEYVNNGKDTVPYPRNSPDVYDGPIDVNEALKKSKNTVAVRLYDILGPRRIFYSLKNSFGLDLVDGIKAQDGKTITDMSCAPLALGQLSFGVSLRKLTEAYGVFPAEGILHYGRSYIAVYDREGRTILNKKISEKRIYSPETSRVMNQLLSNVVSDGTARQIKLKEVVDVAGKTGTSGNDRDRIFIGYTPYITAGIWTGYDRADMPVGYNSPNHLQIWDEVMGKIHDKLFLNGYNEQIRCFNTNNLVVKPYCSKSGMQPKEECEYDEDAKIKFGYFKDGILSEEKCNYH